MKVFEKKLYEELRDMEREMKNKLELNMVSSKIKNYVEEELKDIKVTLRKIECGDYGKCEISGELIPYDLLTSVPIAQSIDDFNKMKTYFKKPLVN
ncbi:hypothetical protein [Neobacillus sp. D3-1R]|uniref:hypothetical protein n=1 Tax=Neobacillus sp. D3-1R TaxID=3445778 RepID=UPI003FA10CD0